MSETVLLAIAGQVAVVVERMRQEKEDMPRVTAVTKLVAAPGKFEELVQAADQMVAAVQDERGTEVYAVSRATKAEQTLFVYEVFTDRAAFKAHAAAGGAVGRLLAPLVASVETLLGEPLVSKSVPADQH